MTNSLTLGVVRTQLCATCGQYSLHVRNNCSCPSLCGRNFRCIGTCVVSFRHGSWQGAPGQGEIVQLALGKLFGRNTAVESRIRYQLEPEYALGAVHEGEERPRQRPTWWSTAVRIFSGDRWPSMYASNNEASCARVRVPCQRASGATPRARLRARESQNFLFLSMFFHIVLLFSVGFTLSSKYSLILKTF